MELNRNGIKSQDLTVAKLLDRMAEITHFEIDVQGEGLFAFVFDFVRITLYETLTQEILLKHKLGKSQILLDIKFSSCSTLLLLVQTKGKSMVVV